MKLFEMLDSEPQPTTSDDSVNPYKVAEGAYKQGTGRLSRTHQAIAAGLSGSVSLLVLSLLLTALALLVMLVYAVQPLSRETNHLMMSALPVGGNRVSVAVSLFAGMRSFQRILKSIRTLSGPTPGQLELYNPIAAILNTEPRPESAWPLKG